MRCVIALAALVGCLPLAAQDDPLEDQLYGIEFLTARVEDHPGESLGLETEAIGTVGSEYRQRLPGETVVELVRANIAPGTWDRAGFKLEFTSGVLHATNRRSVHAALSRYLGQLRARFGRLIVVDAAVVSVDPALAAAVRSAAAPDRPGVLPPDAFRRLLDAAREGKEASLLHSLRVVAQPGQRVSLQHLAKQSYVRDYDVQIATSACELDPVVDVLATGPSVDVRVDLDADGRVTFETRLDVVEFEALVERKLKLSTETVTMSPLPLEPGKTPELLKGPVSVVSIERKVQLPALRHDRVRTLLTVRDRDCAVAASLRHGGRVVLYLLTPGVVALEDPPAADPAPAEQRQLRLLDISPLTRRVQDWEGPSMDLASPARGGGGPLTGARFVLNEPTSHIGEEDVADQIRARVAPGTWADNSSEDPNANRIESTHDGMLLVQHTAGVLREVESLISGLIAARARTITTEALVFGFRKGTRAEWEKTVPALAPGGLFADAAVVDKLLAEALKGGDVRLLDAAEVTGFPQQQVFVVRGREEAYLQDYEPQVSSYSAALDPIIGVFMTGFLMNVRSSFVHGTDRISVDFHAALTSGAMTEVDAFGGAAGALQTPKTQTLQWNAEVACMKGKYTLAALGRRGSGADAEDVAVFVRARPNELK